MSEGVALGLRLERLGPAQALLAAAQRWSLRAARVLEAAEEAAQSSPEAARGPPCKALAMHKELLPQQGATSLHAWCSGCAQGRRI